MITNKKRTKLDHYAGEWVAFVDEKVVVSAESLKKLEESVKKMALKKEPTYFLVPRKDEGPYVLIIKRSEIPLIGTSKRRYYRVNALYF